MNILDKIIVHKKEEIARLKKTKPKSELVFQEFYSRKTFSAKKYLTDFSKTGIIAEFKRKSPSKGMINEHADISEIAKTYTANGASCISVLTDNHFFGGSAEDLQRVRENNIPILRKDFIIDEYQVVESKAIGADLILLIAACLSAQNVQELAFFAKSIGLEVLLEIHNEQELKHICNEIDIIGVNNRDLKSFNVNINRSIELSKQIPADKIKIAESGIDSIETINIFKQAGFNGFLIGEHFMKSDNPGYSFQQFVKQLK